MPVAVTRTRICSQCGRLTVRPHAAELSFDNWGNRFALWLIRLIRPDYGIYLLCERLDCMREVNKKILLPEDRETKDE